MEFDICQANVRIDQMSGSVREKILSGKNCLLLTLCLGLHQCLVDRCGHYIGCFKDVSPI